MKSGLERGLFFATKKALSVLRSGIEDFPGTTNAWHPKLLAKTRALATIFDDDGIFY